MARRRNMRQVLVDVERASRHHGTTKAVMLIDRTMCPECKAELTIRHMDEPTLFRHGGYGATRRTTSVFCETCNWALTVAIDETNPRNGR